MKMKKVLAGWLIVSTWALAAQTEKVVKAKIDHVTVFLRGAQVYRTAPVTLSPGITRIVFEGLEKGIDGKNLQASGSGNFTIMEVTTLSNYPEPQKLILNESKVFPKHIRAIKYLQDSIQELDFDIEDIENKKQVLETEKTTLLNNRLIKGDFKKDSLSILKDALEFLRIRLNNINSETLRLKKEELKLNDARTGMEERLQALKNYNANPGQVQTPVGPNHQVIVTVLCDAPCNGNLEVNYFLQNAGWIPCYDLRSKETSTTMQLQYKARVFQNTGISWDHVKLKLSSSSPSRNNTKPILSAWHLDYYTRYPDKNKRYQHQSMDKEEVRTDSEAQIADSGVSQVFGNDADPKPASLAANYTTFTETNMNFEFDIKLAYTIPSDHVPHLVAVKNEDIPVSLMHYAVPKLDPDAFLTARITNWEDLNLMTGPMNIYFEGTFVGESYLNTTNTDDTLNITLGRDKSVVITRKKLKDKTKERVILNDKEQIVTYEIAVRNAKSIPISINMEDQVPVSNNKEIVVEITDISGANLDANTGLMNWNLTLKPKETKKLMVSYKIKFPKDKSLSAALF